MQHAGDRSKARGLSGSTKAYISNIDIQMQQPYHLLCTGCKGERNVGLSTITHTAQTQNYQLAT